MAGVVVLDAGALIALYSDQDEHHAWALQMFRDTCQLDLEMSALTFAEALVHPTRVGKAKKFISSTAGLGLRVQALLPESAIEIAKLRASTGLKMPEVVVLSQVIMASASLATTDRELAKVANSKNITVHHPF